MSDFKIRYAEKKDNHIIYQFIKLLGEYEKIAHQYLVTEEVLYDSLFVKGQAEALIGEVNGEPVGYALFFSNFSTSLGKAGLYIEDIFILPQYRGRGYGKEIFRYLASIAKERGCSRMEWICLDWNESARRFYESLGAEKMSGWLVYRLEGEYIKKIVGE